MHLAFVCVLAAAFAKGVLQYSSGGAKSSVAPLRYHQSLARLSLAAN